MLPAMPRELSAFKSITERLGVVGFSSMSDRVRQDPLHLALCSLPKRAVNCPSNPSGTQNAVIRSLQQESIGDSVHTGEHLDFNYARLSASQATLDCQKLHGHVLSCMLCDAVRKQQVRRSVCSVTSGNTLVLFKQTRILHLRGLRESCVNLRAEES